MAMSKARMKELVVDYFAHACVIVGGCGLIAWAVLVRIQ